MAELTVYAAIDTMLSQPNPDNNYGGLVTVGLSVTYFGEDKSDWSRVIGNFDMSAIPAGATINSAKMVRNISDIFGSGGSTSKIARLVRYDTWVELEATWNDYASGSAWTKKGAGGVERDTVTPGVITYTEPTSPGQHEVTGLKGYVDDAIANRDNIVSLHMRLDDEDPGSDDTYNWKSSEWATQADRWRLVIDYTPLPTATPAQPTGHRNVPSSPFGETARSARAAAPARAFAGTRTAQPSRPQRRRPR